MSYTRNSYTMYVMFYVVSPCRLPLGDGSSLSLQDYLREESGDRFDNRALSLMDTIQTEGTHPADNVSRVLSVSSCAQVLGRWWGTERVDYSVQSPHAMGMIHTVRYTILL